MIRLFDVAMHHAVEALRYAETPEEIREARALIRELELRAMLAAHGEYKRAA